MLLDLIYGSKDSVKLRAPATQATPVSENTAYVIGERLSGRLDGEQTQHALEVLNGNANNEQAERSRMVVQRALFRSRSHHSLRTLVSALQAQSA